MTFRCMGCGKLSQTGKEYDAHQAEEYEEAKMTLGRLYHKETAQKSILSHHDRNLMKELERSISIYEDSHHLRSHGFGRK